MNLFDPDLQLINTKPVIKSNLKELLSEMKKSKVQTILVLGYKKRNDRKIFHSCTKPLLTIWTLIKHFKSMHQSIMTKMKNYVDKG